MQRMRRMYSAEPLASAESAAALRTVRRQSNSGKRRPEGVGAGREFPARNSGPVRRLGTPERHHCSTEPDGRTRLDWQDPGTGKIRRRGLGGGS